MTKSHEPMESPTVKRRRLGAELRRLRHAAGLTIEDVARLTVWSASKISRVETGRVGILPSQIERLLERYGVSKAEADALADLARQASQRGWWHEYTDVLPDWFSVYIGLENDASALYSYEVEVIPGLLQTESYARAVMAAFPTPDTPDEIDRAVAMRLERQKRLDGMSPLRLHTIINEGALRREVGGEEVMQEQLDKITCMADLENIIVQVLPFSAGAHAGMSTHFSVLEFPNPDEQRVVYLDNMTSALYMEKLKEVGRYRLAFDKMRAVSLPPDESVRLIKRIGHLD
jgi:transcriptional regulator with XRE-family HTH domain